MLKKRVLPLYLGFKFSFSYFTIFPISFKATDNLSTNNVLAFMLFFLPFVGITLGLITVIIFGYLEHLKWYGALISALLYMIFYGFLHTEAIIDVADAIYAKHSGKDAYTIIKEPTIGAMGLLYAVAMLLLKVAGVVFLLLHNYLIEFIAIVTISRLSLLMLFKVHTFRSSFATQLKEALTLPYIVLAFLLYTILGTLLLNHFILLLLAGLLLALIISFTIKNRIGFINGDVLGATLEGVEILLFIGVAL